MSNRRTLIRRVSSPFTASPVSGARVGRHQVRGAAMILLASATAFGPLAVVTASPAAADPIAPSSMPDEGDIGAEVRKADRADAAAGLTAESAATHEHSHGFSTQGGAAGSQKSGQLSAGRAAMRVAALTGPVATRALPAALDARPAYVGQNSCDPVDKPGAVAFREVMISNYGVGRAGISRMCNAGQSEHMEGRAIDWMLDANKPDELAVGNAATEWLSANEGENARRLGVMYIIWNRQMWRAYAPERGWQAYTGAHPHTDHIHVSLTWDGAMKRTSWWTGSAVTASDLGPCRVYTGSPAPIYTQRRTGGCPATVAAPNSSYPVYVPGQTHANIAVAQRALGIGADGQFGMITRRAVLDYQGREGLPRTAVLDKATWARLVPSSVNAAPTATDTSGTKTSPVTQPRVAQPPTRQIPARVTNRYTPYKNTRLGVGSRGTPVRVVQKGLRIQSTGTFDARTRSALMKFQRSWRLPATGRTDLKTWNRLELAQFPWLGYQSTTVRPGQTGRAVSSLQQALRLRADGRFGPQTRAAVLTVQARYGLRPTGIVDPTTWRAIAAQAPK